MFRQVHLRKLSVLFIAGFVTLLQLITTQTQAQSRLIHYWNFNSFVGTYHSAFFPSIGADYSVIDTSKARVAYKWVAGTSATYSGYFDGVAAATVTPDFDTVNLRLGAASGNAFRFRNPEDSAYLLFYIPSTHYENITVKYGSQTSSAASGPTYEVFDYSIDSGLTWKTQGLTTVGGTSARYDSAWTVYHQTTLKFTDPLAFNNPKLVLRIHDSVHITGTSGNIRFDNITVEGDTILSGKLVHYWNFNSFVGVYKTACYTGCVLAGGGATTCSGFYPIAADYSAIDTSKAKIIYGLVPGASACNLGYFDFGASAPADFDTVNLWQGAAGGNYVRMRNPNDSSQFLWYMPTTGYKNIVLRWGAESSSVASGDSVEVFDYSVDSGATWRISGLSKAYDSAWVVFNPITVSFTDPAVNNNPKFVFRIRLRGHNTGTSGNNRFDNISVQGDSIIATPPAITTASAAYGPLCNSAANNISVGYSSTGTITGPYLVQITNSNGIFPTNTTSNIIGSGISSPIAAVIPAGTAPGILYRVRVVNAFPTTYGSDNGSNIILAGIAPPISGSTNACTGATDTLADGSVGGTWSSSSASVATIGITSGVVYGVATGTTSITYTVGAGCTASTTITVLASPATVGGTLSVCQGSTTTLSDATGAGTWAAGTTSVATVVTGSGVVSGITSGTSSVTFTLTSNGCPAYATVTVNPLPSAITGTTTVCAGATTTLSDAGGGTWSSSNTSLATVVSGTGVVTGVAAGVPFITYTLPTTCKTTTTVNVLSLPSPIAGPTTGCVGTNFLLTNATAFGSWSSSNPSVAAIGSGTGSVTSVAVGSAVISYSLSTGCYTTQTVTINSLPSLITGTASVCAGLTTTLSNGTSGGTWSSSVSALATVNPSTGAVTGIAAGNPVISYTLSTGCFTTSTFTVNPLPATIGGQTSVYCIGSTAALTDASAGGTWSSSNTSIATVGLTNGIVTGVAAGTSNITYKLPTGCIATLSENISSSPATITGPVNACVTATVNYSDVTAYGAWSTSDPSIAIVGSGTGLVTGVAIGTTVLTYQLSSFCLTTKTITVSPVPDPITGVGIVCPGTTAALGETTTGGFWTSSVPGLASVNFSTGVVTGIAAGNPVISYILPTGCNAVTTVTVNPSPAPIGGETSVYCIGSTATLTDASPGGTWASSNTTVASVDPTGIVTGVTPGVAVITYTLPTGCITTLTEAISSTPAPIAGSTTACVATTTSLSDVTAFGAWSTSNSLIADIGSGTGLVTGVSPGTATITYELSAFCLITKTITVNPSPAAITGASAVCLGSATTLSDADPAGTWSSSVPVIASVDVSTGVVSGLIAGTVSVSYTLPTGCNTTTTVTVNPLSAITGPTNICLGAPSTLSGVIAGGTWMSSNTSIASIDPASGIITGTTLGTVVVYYTLPTSCVSTTTVTVSPPPYPITGTLAVCEGLTTTLSAAGGGGWFSSNPAVASVGFGTGMVTGVVAGTTTITYTLGTSCVSTAVVTVNPSPAAITGPSAVCVSATITLADATTGGTWSGGSGFATVNSATGDVSGSSAGAATITYTLPAGCQSTATVTVNPITPVTGPSQVCEAATITLADATGTGAWTSGSTSIATVDAVTGVVTGVAAGTSSFTYTLSTGCSAMTTVTVNPVPVVYTVTGGGNYCTGTPGRHIYLSGSQAGIDYQLYLGSTPTGSAVTGSGASIDFGIFTAAGTYSVSATNTTTGCTSDMAVRAIVTPITSVIPSVAITNGTTNDSICTGMALTFVAAPVNGGTTPSYQWWVNGAMAGTDSANYTYYPANGDVITAKLTSSATCAIPDTAMSNVITMVVNPYEMPTVSTTATPGNSVCAGTSVSFAATETYGGSDPTYTWLKNNIAVGTNAPSYSVIPLNGDNITVVLRSNLPCRLADTVHSAPIIMHVDSSYIPVVTISATPGLLVQHTQNDTFRAAVVHAGPSPTYRWLKNGTVVPGATNAIYIANGFNNNDSVTCFVTAPGSCGMTSFNSVFVHIGTSGIGAANAAGQVNIYPNPNKGTFTVKGWLGVTEDREVSLEITDVVGRVLYKAKVTAVGGNLDEQVQLTNLPSNGTYILNLRSESYNNIFHVIVAE